MPLGRCGDCLYWDQLKVKAPKSFGSSSIFGHCKRHAPSPTPLNEAVLIQEYQYESQITQQENEFVQFRKSRRLFQWPLTINEDGCGEFEQRGTGMLP